jgi:hypothetical protein
VYLEAISYKLGLNFMYDLNSIGVNIENTSLDFHWVNSAGYGFSPGVHSKKSFQSFSSAKSYYNSTYSLYKTSDMGGSSVGVEYIQGNVFAFNFSANIRILDILNNYIINYTIPVDVQRTEEINRSIAMHKASVENLINNYKVEYEPFITFFPTIYAYIYTNPGHFNFTELLEIKRQIIMNKRI